MSKPLLKKNRGRKPQGGVIGLDEVGRGPLAGPVTVCAFYIGDKKLYKALKDTIFGDTIKDSKKLTKSLRNKIYLTIRDYRDLEESILFATSSRSAAFIDAYGINNATRACTMSCMRSLAKQGVDIYSATINLDAGLVLPIENPTQKSHIKGDEHFLEIALASIVAKVTRDRFMEKLARTHPEYAWEMNVGYGTKHHRKAIKTKGVTNYHRMSYLKGFKLFDKAE